jgi:hypothetical protein
MKIDHTLDTLLALDGTEYTEENGFWYKIEAKRIEPSEERPHGIRYNLTLHDNNNQRILGFDNAHGIKVKKGGKYSGYIYQYDHVHKSAKDQGQPYEFINAEQLLSDFLAEINKIIKMFDGGGK